MSKARTLSDKATAGRKNAIINGNFDIWQRGTSFNNSNGYTADRWLYAGNFINSGGSVTVSREMFSLGQTGVPNNPEYFIRINHTVASSGATASVLRHRIEGVETLAGKTITLSFYARTGGGTEVIEANLIQNFGTGGTPSSNTSTSVGESTSLTTDWQKFEYTVSLPSVSGKTVGSDGNDFLQVEFGFPIDELSIIDIAQVQLEKGSVATDFEQRPIGEELALCQRYYEEGSFTGFMGIQNSSITQNYYTMVAWKVVKRTVPTVTGTSNQGTFSAISASTSSSGIGRSNVVANRVNSGNYEADAEL